MNEANKKGRYGHVAIALHWLIAVLFVLGFCIGWIMTDIHGFTPTKLRYFSWHKWIGVTVFVFVVVRIIWRIRNPAPQLPVAMHLWERFAAHLGHMALYVLMVAVPVTGYFYSSAAGIQVVYLGVFPLPTIIGPDAQTAAVLRFIHMVLDYALLGVVAVHVLAVVKHQVIDRQRILSRMLPFGSTRD
jgi:cytochrome b561